MAKVEAIDLYDAREKVAIVDSVTELNMAMEASLVFARDRQAKYLDERHKSYIPWNDFFEVRDRQANRWDSSYLGGN